MCVPAGWDRALNGTLYTSAYCVRKGLTRKANMAYNLKKWASKHPAGALARALPETLLFEFWDMEYFDEALAEIFEVRDMKCDGSERFILKPSMANQARRARATPHLRATPQIAPHF